jgi:hypothetical protein
MATFGDGWAYQGQSFFLNLLGETQRFLLLLLLKSLPPKVAILGHQSEKNLFRNRESRTMASAKLADQKGSGPMPGELGTLRSVQLAYNPE